MDDVRGDSARLTESELDDGTPRGERALVCAACGAVVTSQHEAIEVDGSHVHTRLNPANVVFRFGCFRLAVGVVVSGAPSSEHVWFTGYRWQYAHCSRCGAHLGWAFTSAAGEGGADVFFGLVLDRLSQAP